MSTNRDCPLCGSWCCFFHLIKRLTRKTGADNCFLSFSARRAPPVEPQADCPTPAWRWLASARSAAHVCRSRRYPLTRHTISLSTIIHLKDSVVAASGGRHTAGRGAVGLE